MKLAVLCGTEADRSNHLKLVRQELKSPSLPTELGKQLGRKTTYRCGGLSSFVPGGSGRERVCSKANRVAKASPCEADEALANADTPAGPVELPDDDVEELVLPEVVPSDWEAAAANCRTSSSFEVGGSSSATFMGELLEAPVVAVPASPSSTISCSTSSEVASSEVLAGSRMLARAVDEDNANQKTANNGSKAAAKDVSRLWVAGLNILVFT